MDVTVSSGGLGGTSKSSNNKHNTYNNVNITVYEFFSATLGGLPTLEGCQQEDKPGA